MRNKKVELDVDFIGQQGLTLTKEEQQAISDFIKYNKAKSADPTKRKSIVVRNKTTEAASHSGKN